MASTQSKRQKLASTNSTLVTSEPSVTNARSSADGATVTSGSEAESKPALRFAATTNQQTTNSRLSNSIKRAANANNSANNNNFGVGDVDDLTDDTDLTDDDEDDDEDEDEDDAIDDGDILNGNLRVRQHSSGGQMDIQDQLAAAGPAGVAAAAAIATARKRKRPHTFETNPSVRKRQQTRLIRKLRACIDEYTMRVGQQAVVLITMPGKTQHNFKVFGAQPLESVIRACKHEIMVELEQALLDQAPQQFREDANKHELPPLVIDGIPTPVEKMTQAQLRAFIPLMLKYSTGRGKPGWGKDTTRPLWWPETLPWANVRSDARDESEKQRISWTTTLRQIVTNCYKYHGRDDLLPTFDENEESLKQQQQEQEQDQANQQRRTTTGDQHQRITLHHRSGRGSNKSDPNNVSIQQHGQLSGTTIYSTATPTYTTSNFMHTISNPDGSVSLIQLDPANAQILTLPDGTQVRAVRLQTLGSDGSVSGTNGQQLTVSGELTEAGQLELSQALNSANDNRQQQQQDISGGQTLSVTEASLGPDGQIIVTGEDGIQSCYPMSSLVSIPASMYQQFTQGGQQLSIMTADGQSLSANAVSILQESDLQPHQQRIITLGGGASGSSNEEQQSEGGCIGEETSSRQANSADSDQGQAGKSASATECKSEPKDGAEGRVGSGSSQSNGQ